jgi:hypothetical protein
VPLALLQLTKRKPCQSGIGSVLLASTGNTNNLEPKEAVNIYIKTEPNTKSTTYTFTRDCAMHLDVKENVDLTQPATMIIQVNSDKRWSSV